MGLGVRLLEKKTLLKIFKKLGVEGNKVNNKKCHNQHLLWGRKTSNPIKNAVSPVKLGGGEKKTNSTKKTTCIPSRKCCNQSVSPVSVTLGRRKGGK